MIRITILTILVLLSFSGCCEKELVYKDRIIEKKVPIKCIIPEVNCTIEGNDVEKVGGLHACIINLREASEKCKGK